jgi:hypothetical protein
MRKMEGMGGGADAEELPALTKSVADQFGPDPAGPCEAAVSLLSVVGQFEIPPP